MQLSEYLSARGLKPADMARLLNVENSTVTRILRRERRPSLDLAARIEAVTNGEVTCRELAGEPV